MDMSLVASAMMMQAANLQSNIDMSVLKSSNDAEKQVVQALLGTQTSSQANLGSGVGGLVDTSA
jgi:hypothetical protein